MVAVACKGDQTRAQVTKSLARRGLAEVAAG